MEKQARKEKEREKAARAAGRDPKRVRFINNLVLLEAAARGDLDEGACPLPIFPSHRPFVSTSSELALACDLPVRFDQMPITSKCREYSQK